ncbi:transcription/translation regulatory transformer protein RfaH [Ferrimonas marina]|uniref:Transcription antitermination protein RfaH n=1 Tax=Ferrimonas marina TaxID=299255 RepID=A0A1M5VKQ6_9GAMM|nr:transcription/translation regulatory transformer protein RfaH [Ferrimonas marina]SHH75758.1 transcriptional antiterminator RfaH [Ferrimonas marina]
MQGWYLLYCKGKQEATAKMHLEQRQIACFLPETEVERLKGGKRVKELQPLFPNYLFVRFDPHITPIRSIRSVPGVSSLVKTDGQITPVETSLVVSLRQRDVASSSMRDLPEVGDRVRILEGPFAELEAVYAEPDGETRSMLLLQLLGKQQRLSMDNLSFGRL